MSSSETGFGAGLAHDDNKTKADIHARILVIDDDDVVRRLIREILVRNGHDVVDAPNGLQGVRKYLDDPADLVVTDIFMPEKDGYEIIDTLRKSNPKVKIIAISGGATFLDDSHVLKMAKLLGADKTLPKPLGKEELLGAVADVLSQNDA